MSNVPLPEPDIVVDNTGRAWSASMNREVDGIRYYAASHLHAHAAAVSAAKDKEIAQLRAELIKSLADNAALRAEVAGLREDAERWRWAVKRKNIVHWNDDYKPPFVVIRFHGDVTAQGHHKTLNEAVDAARKQKP